MSTAAPRRTRVSGLIGLLPCYSVRHTVPPRAGAEIKAAHHTLSPEAGLLQRSLLGDVPSLGPPGPCWPGSCSTGTSRAAAEAPPMPWPQCSGSKAQPISQFPESRPGATRRRRRRDRTVRRGHGQPGLVAADKPVLLETALEVRPRCGRNPNHWNSPARSGSVQLRFKRHRSSSVTARRYTPSATGPSLPATGKQVVGPRGPC